VLDHALLLGLGADHEPRGVMETAAASGSGRTAG
jgi:hypothetical protein